MRPRRMISGYLRAVMRNYWSPRGIVVGSPCRRLLPNDHGAHPRPVQGLPHSEQFVDMRRDRVCDIRRVLRFPRLRSDTSRSAPLLVSGRARR